jgi:hypothetical protein
MTPPARPFKAKELKALAQRTLAHYGERAEDFPDDSGHGPCPLATLSGLLSSLLVSDTVAIVRRTPKSAEGS